MKLDSLPFRERTLANGLHAITLEDHRSATVSVNIGYRVGGKDDPPGRSGFAHLFEHLMFKGTNKMRAETFDRLTEDVGGYNNAYTTEDYTNYYEVVPSNNLETILWAEADRLSGLIVDDANFATEREVVIGEYDQRILAEPYGMLGEIAQQSAYAVHPYRRGVIGDPANLRAATLDDVRSFHSTYYRPDNATLIVVGDFETAKCDEWIDRYFGPLVRPDAPIPRVHEIEPPQTSERRIVHRSTLAPLPALQLSWHIGDARAADIPTLDLIETILGTGRSSRFYRSLVYTHQVATQAWAGADWSEQPGLFSIRAIASAGKTIPEMETLINAELESLGRGEIGPDELEKAKMQLFASMVRGRSNYTDVAQAMMRSIIARGSARALDEDVARYAAVDAAMISEAVKRTFRPENLTVVEYLPAGEAA